MSVETISRTRSVSLGLAGLACLSYAILAIVQNRPDPIWWAIPGLAGIAASVLIFLAFAKSDGAAARAANDELYLATVHKAQRHGFWIAVAMYPLFALGVIYGGLTWATVFAAMGTLTGAAYLLLSVYYEWRVS